jgi:hypothetical protein
MLPQLTADAMSKTKTAAPVASQDARSMRIVHHHDGAIFFRQIAERGQRADVAVHGKYAVGDEQFFPRLVLYTR